MKKILIGLVVFVVIAFGVNFFSDTVRTVNDLPRIHYTEAFAQDEADYIVYFYQENCSFCEALRPSVIEAANNGVPIFIVDIGIETSKAFRYDWEAHAERYNSVIGKIENDQEILFEDVSLDDFPREEGWEVRHVGNEIVVILNKAQNNTEPQSVEELEVIGSPTLLRITNEAFAGYAEGVDQGVALLELFGK